MTAIKVSVIIDEFFQKNQFFNETDVLVNRDDCLRPWVELKKNLLALNIQIDTVDITPISNADILLFINIPKENDPYYREALKLKKKLFCVITELDLIHKENSKKTTIDTFDKIFTYQSNFIDNQKFFKINYSFDFKNKVKEFKVLPFNDRSKLAVLIAGNKTLKHKKELYSKRIDIIKWFEKHHLKDLDLYGNGWNKIILPKKITINYNSFGFFKFFFSNYFKSYKGVIERKNEILKRYKFSFCYENAFNVEGWITEKIFDSIFNGCIPIYWGIDEINAVVDKNCFIDMRNFKSYQELYTYISTMNETEFNRYIKNIENYLIRKAADQDFEFGIPYFVSTITDQIIKSISS